MTMTRFILPVTILILSCSTVYANFNVVLNQNGITAYQNANKSIRVVQRRQTTPINSSLNTNEISQIAQARMKSLEGLQMGLHDFKIETVFNKPVQLEGDLKAYVWSGSYKDKNGKIHFFKEYITAGYTWNVFTDKKRDLNQANRIVRELIKT